MTARLTPELDVDDLDRSLAFYVGVLGFRTLFDRPEDRFAYLDLDGVHLMLEEAAGPGRRFRTAPLEHPYGRGVNFQIEVIDVDAMHARVCSAGVDLLIPLEEAVVPPRPGGERQSAVCCRRSRWVPPAFLHRSWAAGGAVMTDQLPAIVQPGALTNPSDTYIVPAVIANASDAAGWRYEFFTANIHNSHTCRAYARATAGG